MKKFQFKKLLQDYDTSRENEKILHWLRLQSKIPEHLITACMTLCSSPLFQSSALLSLPQESSPVYV